MEKADSKLDSQASEKQASKTPTYSHKPWYIIVQKLDRCLPVRALLGVATPSEVIERYKANGQQMEIVLDQGDADGSIVEMQPVGGGLSEAIAFVKGADECYVLNKMTDGSSAASN